MSTTTTTATALSLAEGVCKATTSLISVYTSIRQIRKQEITELKYRIKAYTMSSYSRYVGHVVRTNIEEIAKTQHCIDEYNLTGATLNYAMKQLEILNDNLALALRGFQCAH